ncbi:MAG TPA: ATP-binding protein [bacterium]|nr:ATP-binding protein [bacterium]
MDNRRHTETSFIGHVWLDQETGEITATDATFDSWADPGQRSHIDRYLAEPEGASFFEAIQGHLTPEAPAIIPAVTSFDDGQPDQLMCFLPAQPVATDLPVTMVPLAQDAPETDVAAPPPQVFDVITDFVLVCDPTYTIVRANRAAQAVYGGLQPVEGRKCYQVLRGRNHPCADCPLPTTLETGRLIPTEFYDRQLREFLEIRTYPHVTETGRWQDFTILTRVISERRRREGETAQTRKLLALGQMASGLAHDFNNRLTVILGRVQLLKSRTTDPEVRSSLRTIEAAAFDSTDIIQRLQDFTRAQMAEEGDQFAPVEVNALIRDVQQYVETRTARIRQQEGIRITIETQLREVARIEGHRDRLRNAFLNVALNAIEAMEIGGVLRLWTQQLGRQVEIGIVDTGVGMAKTVREQMFDPFFTTKGSRKNGLGLSEVYGIVNQHHGSIHVDSTPGEGTTISMYFPALIPESQE